MRFATAIGISVAFHAALAAGIGICLARTPKDVFLADLDLSSLELSFAEEDAPDAQVALSQPATVPEDPPPMPPPELPPNTFPASEPPPAPPDPEGIDLPEPSPAPPPMDLPLPAVAPVQARVDAQPLLRKPIRPDYPRGSRLRGEEGAVLIEIDVDASGTVSSAAIVSACPYSELNEAALKAVRKARFTPARQGGDHVPCTVRVTLNFRLTDSW